MSAKIISYVELHIKHGLNSLNCTRNAFANQIHRIRYDFHPYVWEIAYMVRSGVLTREEGIVKIVPPEDKDMVAYSQKELGMA